MEDSNRHTGVIPTSSHKGNPGIGERDMLEEAERDWIIQVEEEKDHG